MTCTNDYFINFVFCFGHNGGFRPSWLRNGDTALGADRVPIGDDSVGIYRSAGLNLCANSFSFFSNYE